MRQDDLFGGEAKLVPVARPKAGVWTISDHACRHCMGRILIRPLSQRTIVRCAECGAEALGDGPDALCYCGVKVGQHGTVFECFRNIDAAVNAPQQVLVRERKPDKPKGAR